MTWVQPQEGLELQITYYIRVFSLPLYIHINYDYTAIRFQFDYALHINLGGAVTLLYNDVNCKWAGKGKRKIGRTERVEVWVQAHTPHQAVLVVH